MKHVLIVEDNDEHAFLLQIQLGKLGFLSSVCVNIFHILDKVQHGMIDAITIDIGLSEINGVEVIKHVRRIDKDILIIVITSFSDESTRIHSLKSGANYHLIKPYKIEDLKTILSKVK